MADIEVKKNKNLANCTLKEFLQQVNKIKHKAADFYKVIGIADIRAVMPEFKGDETPEERKKMITKQGYANISKIIDKCIDENIDATIELMGLFCFKTVEEAENMEVSEFMDNLIEIISSSRCIDFFMKMANLGLIDTGKLF